MANRRRRTKEERIKIKKIKLGIFFVITVLLAVSFIFTSQIEGLLNTNTQKQTESTTIEQIGEDGLKVHFINVGQGDSAVVELPDNKIMMIDAGDKDAKDTILNYLDDVIFEDGYNKIDYLVLTHSDEDHIGSAPDVIEKYDIGYSCIAVEILEDKNLNDDEKSVMVANLARLKEKGILILLDDFGKGYTSFGDLTEFDISIVKIDKNW